MGLRKDARDDRKSRKRKASARRPPSSYKLRALLISLETFAGTDHRDIKWN